MNTESMDALRYDRRLARRRGWISAQDLKQVEEGLPDVANKATTLGNAADAGEGGSASEAHTRTPVTTPDL